MSKKLKITMKKTLLLFCLLLITKVGFSASIYITSSQEWANYMEKVDNTIPESDIVNIKKGVSITVKFDVVNYGRINIAGDVVFENSSTIMNKGKINVAGSITLGINSTCEHFGTINCTGSFIFNNDALIVHDNAIINRSATASLSLFKNNSKATVKTH